MIMSFQPHVTRVSRSKQEARNNYDTMSALYDIMARSEQKYNEMGIQQLALTEGEDVLEIGFGTGQCLLSMAEKVCHYGVVCGIDISEGMSRIAQGKIQKAGFSREVLLIMGDAASHVIGYVCCQCYRVVRPARQFIVAVRTGVARCAL